MNYYPFHLGDYAAHTAHLEPLEDLAYRRMLDAYYLREGPLPHDVAEIARLVRLRDHQATIRDVINEFFHSTEDGWSHTRCDEEIDRMQDKQAKARASAAASVNARRARVQPVDSERSANVEQTLNERSTDVELPTPTPTPTPTPEEKKKRSASAAPVVCPPDVDQKVWADFLAIRKAKRAPLTDTALNGLNREAAKAGMTLADTLALCCTRGWQSFKAEWIASPRTATSQVGQPRTVESFYERDQRLKAERVAQFAPGIAAKPAVSFDFIEGGVSDVTAIESD